jgi:hypothetical protein
MTSIRLYQNSDKQLWDAYVLRHPDSTHCHLSGWKEVIEKAYGHKAYYLMALQSSNDNSINPTNRSTAAPQHGSTVTHTNLPPTSSDLP